jgi:hypothetical protein
MEATYSHELWSALHTCANWLAALPTGVRKPEEQYDVEENIYIHLTKTVTCEATDINPGNSQL